MDASLCPKLLSESILDEEEVVKVSGRVNDQETGLKIAEVVTALGPLLTHKEVPKRQLGCQFLSQCLVKIREDHLDLAEIHLLATFLIDRLQDSPLMLSPALQGFSALSGMKQLGDEDLHAIVRALLFELHCQSLTVKDRSRILDLLHFSLTGPRLRPLLDGPLAGQFVHGFLQCVEGETNPRNLNVIFGCWPIILEHFDCGIFLEDIFEVLSCYFPIDFSQPKNNPYSVTKEDLTRGLEASLEASDKFAPYAIPLFMEKLSSDLVEAKIDSLSCFRSCLRKYSPAQLAPSLKDVWNSCKQEIMGIRANSDKKVIEMTYKLLEAVTCQLGSAIQSPANNGILHDWIDFIWSDLKSFLKFLESNLMETAVEILARVSHSDKIVAEALVNKSVPVLIEVAEKSEDKDRVLDLISRMLMAKKHKSKSSPEYAPALLSLCDKCLGSNERPIRDAAMRSLRFGREAFHYSLIEDALVQGFTLSVKDPEYLFVAEKIELTAVLGEIDAQKVEDWVGSVLPFGPGSEQNIQILVGLSCRQSDRYTVQLFPELLKALHAPGLRLTAISAIHSICAKSPETQYAFFISDQRLLDQIFDMKEITNEEIEKCKPLVRLTGQKMVNEKQLPKLQDIVARFFSGDSSSVPDVLYETLLCSLSQPIVNGLDWKEGFTASIENQERKAVSKVLGSVLNKSSDLKAVQPYLGELGKAKHVAFITKGLLMRGSKEGNVLIKCILDQYRKSPDSFHMFTDVLQDSEDYSKANHFRILPFYKQKFFLSTFPTLMQLFKDEGNEIVLDAILRQLPFVPPSVIESEISPLIPDLAKALFIQNCSLEKPARMSPAIKSFLDFLKHMDSKVQDGLAPLMLPYLIKVAQSDGSTIQEKIAALESLKSSASEHVALDVRKSVISETRSLLNHPKRLVRKEAAEARNRWMIMI